MSAIIDELKAIFGDLPEDERMPAVLDALEEGIKNGIIKAIRDDNGEVRYIHTEHYRGEAIVPLEQVIASHQRMLYGQELS